MGEPKLVCCYSDWLCKEAIHTSVVSLEKQAL